MQSKDTAKIEWPKEKLLHYGADKLTKSELLAILLRIGTKNLDVIESAKNILRQYPKFSLADSNVAELEEKFGLEPGKACELIACFELGRRMAEEKTVPIDSVDQDMEMDGSMNVAEEDMLAKFGSENFSQNNP